VRTPTAKEYCHDQLGDRFAQALSTYDTERRLEALTDRFLTPERLRGSEALDVGAGLGFFSRRMKECGADVTACDIGENLLAAVQASVGCRCACVDALALVEYFGRSRFDIVLSSECIEHTPDPMGAVRQMAAVLRPGGWLALSTPNLIWYPVVRGATMLRLRPFDGLENFSTFGGLRRTLESSGITIEKECGLHLFPFQLPLHALSRWCDDHLQFLRKLMINICILGRKTRG
jgi:2-polyprenyl-3-methyl-5-hydroxy-6-metoxy-1,4-benzoquinol methylase